MPVVFPALTTAESDTATSGDALTPIDPFTALRFRFGMLLGVEDLETGQAYPRGKIRLHNAWLHRAGAVWGLDVRFDPARNDELTVSPGLALDGAGRELRVDSPLCLDVGAWYAEHRTDPGFEFVPDGTRVRFSAQLVIQFRACLARQVPALAEPCEGSYTDTAYSRVIETAELALRPITAAEAPPYHRLRLLFGLDAPYAGTDPDLLARDAGVVNRRAEIRALPVDQQPAAYLQTFRRLAAEDAVALQPGRDPEHQLLLFPEGEDTVLPLADIRDMLVEPRGAGFAIAAPLPVAPDGIDLSVRPTHVATATIQELLCGPIPPAAGGGGPAPDPGPVDAAGPRALEPPTLAGNRRSLTVRFSKALAADSVGPGAFSITTYNDGDGWAEIELKPPVYTATATTFTVELPFREQAAGLVRLIVRGTGPTPILGHTPRVPFAGGPGAPPGGVHQGNDFVFMLGGS